MGIATPGTGNIFHLALVLTATTYDVYYNGVSTVSGSFSGAISPVFSYLQCATTGNSGGGGGCWGHA